MAPPSPRANPSLTPADFVAAWRRVVAAGTGVLVMAADNNEVTGNEIRGNDCYGVAVFSLEVAFEKGTAFDVGAIPPDGSKRDLFVGAARDANDRPNSPTTITKIVIRDAKADEKGPTPK